MFVLNPVIADGLTKKKLQTKYNGIIKLDTYKRSLYTIDKNNNILERIFYGIRWTTKL